MGFRETKSKFLRALKDGSIQHESREWNKNWLAEERISLEEAFLIVSQTRGQDCAKPSPHHFDSGVEVWVFKPVSQGVRWYVKGYCLEDEVHLTELYLISFHPSESEKL